MVERIQKVVLWIVIISLGFIPRAVNALEGLQMGMKAPYISLQSLEGEAVSLADFPKPKMFLIIFWSTWSTYSEEELIRLEELHRKYQDMGLVVIGVNVENQTISPNDIAAINKLVQDLRLSFPILLDKGLETFRAYGVIAVPSTVLLGKDLTIKGEMAAYPITEREDFFTLVEYSIQGKEVPKKIRKVGYQPVHRAIRYYNLSWAIGARGLTDLTEANLKKSIESDPKFISPLILLGQLYKERSLKQLALEYHGQTINLSNADTERDSNMKKAVDTFQKALSIDPQNASVLTELASIDMLQGQTEGAKSKLSQALKLAPSYTPAHYYLAWALMKEGDTKGAEKEFEAAKKLNPLDYKVYYYMAQAYEEKGLLKEAMEAYKKSFEILWASRRSQFSLSYARW